MFLKIKYCLLSLLMLFALLSCNKEGGQQRNRVYILTDISSLKNDIGEPDDTQSLIRFLLYANEFDIEGFGATYSSHGDTIYPQYLEKVLYAYGQSIDKLKRYGDYPDACELMHKIKKGNPAKGVNQIGEGKDTDLSAHIIEVLKKSDNRPLWVLIWGGSLDLAQALWRIRESIPEEEAGKLIRMLRVYSILDQYDKSGQWIRENFKDLFFILNNGSFQGVYRTGNTDLVSSEWVEANILSNPAPLAQMYPNYNGGDPWGKVKGVKEGDSPSFLYLLPHSPGDPENPEIDSWGGNFKRVEGSNHYVDCQFGEALSVAGNISKWRMEFQSDFIKRLSWLME